MMHNIHHYEERRMSLFGRYGILEAVVIQLIFFSSALGSRVWIWWGGFLFWLGVGRYLHYENGARGHQKWFSYISV